MPRIGILLACAVLGLAVLGCSHADDRALTHRWLFIMRNHRQPENVEATFALIPRAAAAGYKAIVLSEGGIYDVEAADETYRGNLLRIQAAAKEHGLELIPAVMPIGYSGGILGRNPNLAEGTPVRDALFVVRDGRASLQPDPPISLPGGDFERIADDRFEGWDWYDNPGESTVADHTVVHSGHTSVRMERIDEVSPTHGHCRFMKTLKLSPFRQYHLSAWIKTEDFQAPGSVRISLLAPLEEERTVASLQPEIEPTQDWRQYDLVFNSLQWDELRLYLGTWGGKAGRIWWDDIELEEVGLLNVLRRPGCPVTVRGENGTPYAEGRDYEPIRDPNLHPWQMYHEPPTIRLTSDSRIVAGERLRVSYYHPTIINRWQVTCCLSDPEVYDILREQVRAVNDLLHPTTFFMQHDEIRHANWDKACQDRGLTPGQLLADNVRRCVEIIHDISPDAKIWVWSDMFDPHHNAVDNYYLVNGSWAGSWEGLPPEVGIVNWANHLKGENLKWFADRGHEQVLAGYYDHDTWIIGEWLAAREGLPGIDGAMYTTWQNNYQHMEEWARAAWGESGP